MSSSAPLDGSAPGGDTAPPSRRDQLGLLLLLGLAAAIMAATWYVANRHPAPARSTSAAADVPIPANVPPPPAIEPLQIRELPPEEAVAINAAVPFSKAPNPAARPFHYAATAPADLERAIDCLAAAGYYEAGDDSKGQRAVDQVVINRLRHPAFPKTICGVVFQGSERTTGCQFTFTCDGAMARTPSAAAWERARKVAKDALTGSVYRPVGHATHYHTNWVVPYWSARLDKITAVDTHLFFRWTGWWGTPPAFRGRASGSEPAIGLLARLASSHSGAVPTEAQQALLGVGLIAATEQREAEFLARFDPGAIARASKHVVSDGDSFIVLLDKQAPADSYAAVALSLCGARAYCKVMGWTQAATTPGRFPIPDSLLKGMSFSYLRNRGEQFAKPLWNCTEFKRADPGECMKARVPAAPAASAEPPPKTPAPAPVSVVAPPAAVSESKVDAPAR